MCVRVFASENARVHVYAREYVCTFMNSFWRVFLSSLKFVLLIVDFSSTLHYSSSVLFSFFVDLKIDERFIKTCTNFC